MHAKSLQSCDSAMLWTVACQAPLSVGFSRQEYWNWLPYPLPGDLFDPRIELESLQSPALAGEFFTTSITWEALLCILYLLNTPGIAPMSPSILIWSNFFVLYLSLNRLKEKNSLRQGNETYKTIMKY